MRTIVLAGLKESVAPPQSHIGTARLVTPDVDHQLINSVIPRPGLWASTSFHLAFRY